MLKIKNILRIKIINLLLLFLCNVILSNAQNNVDCFTKFQLIKMQKSSLNDMREFLNNEGWSFDGAKSNQSFNYFDYYLNYNMVQWGKSRYNNNGNLLLYNLNNKPNIIIYQASSGCFQELMNAFSSNSAGATKVEENILSTSFIEAGVTIEFREYREDYSIKQYSILIYNSLALQQEIKKERDKKDALIKAAQETETKHQNIVIEADILFNSKRYEDAKLQYNLANQLQYNSDIENKIKVCNDAICDKIISNADNQFEAGNYESSIISYQQAISCTQNISLVQNKIIITKNKIKENKIKEKLLLADSYFAQNNFEFALNEYNQVLTFDDQNISALEGVNKINYIKDILYKRKTSVFSYQKTNPLDYSSFNNNLQKNLNNIIEKRKNGIINIDLTISFDTLGNNSSLFKLNSSSDIKYLDFLNNGINFNSLNSYKLGGYFISTRELINIDLKWQTERLYFKSNSRGNRTFDHSEIDNSIFTKFINSQNYKYGQYTFEVKTKTLNSNNFTDIKLVKYKTAAGPASALYSMLLPGMGTLKVTNGQKGWGRFVCFIVSSGLAIGSKLYSDQQYKNYISATDQPSIDKYYNSANNSHKVALISIAVTSSIYLYDVIWVFSKGIKNQKETKYLRKQLKQGPIEIQSQLISL